MAVVPTYPRPVVVVRGVLVSLLALFAACHDEAQPQPNNEHDAPPWTGCPCAQQPPSGACGGELCGNGQIDQCWTVSPMGCHCVEYTQELCDGNGQDCTAYGYYGGSAACTSTCSGFDRGSCDACAPNGQCATFPQLGARTAATSGQLLATVSSTGIAIFDGLTKVHEVAVSDVFGLVAVPAGGWLLLSAPAGLSTLDAAGVHGTVHAIPAEMEGARMAAAGNRVALAWTTQVGTAWRVDFAIADTNGTIVVPTATLLTGASEHVDVASDGTGFFVASDGHVARVAPDGTFAIVDGFPLAQPAPRVLWSGTTGWYVVGTTGTSYTAQRFDATGAKVGAAISFDEGAPGMQFVADGTDLVAARLAGSKVVLAHIDATGTVGADIDVGGGDASLAYVGRRGSDIIVVWNRPEHLQLALVAP